MQGKQENSGAATGSRASEPVKAEGKADGAGAGSDGANAITAAFRDIIAPLVRADGGHLYLLSVTRDEVHVHLTGTCAGCPGASTTRDKMIQPILHAVAPNLHVRLTTGWSVPDGATEIE